MTFVAPSLVFPALDFGPRRQSLVDREHHRDRIRDERVAEFEAEIAAIEDRGVDACQWPIGDPRSPAFRFCGDARRDDGTSYCAHHHGIAYVPRGVRPASSSFVLTDLSARTG